MRFLKVFLLTFCLCFSISSSAQFEEGFGGSNFGSSSVPKETIITEKQQYSGLTANQRETLRNAGYTDAQINQFSESLNEYVNNTNSRMNTTFSKQEIEMYQALDQATNGVFSNTVVDAKNNKIREEADNSTWEDLKRRWFGLNPITAWFDGKPSFVKIHNALVSNNNGCLFCPIFEKLFNAVNTFATSIAKRLTDVFIKLLSLGLLFFILFKVLKAVFSFSEIDPKQFFTDLFMPIIKAMIAVIILLDISGYFGSSTFYNKVVTPLVQLSVGFSNEIQGTEKIQVLVVEKGVGSKVKEQNACQASSSAMGDADTPLGNGVNEAIQCFLITISVSLINYIAMGASFVGDCWGSGGFPNVWMFFVGLCILIPTFTIYVTLPFKLLDGIFSLMFVFALMPLWVILWVLPATREYSQKAFTMFLRVLITFVCVSVVLLMTLKILSVMLDGMSAENQKKFWDYLFSDHTTDAAKLIDFSTGAFFTCVAMSFLALALIEKTETFVDQFAGGGGLGIGKNIEGLARGGVQLVGRTVVKPMAGVAAKGVGYAVGKTAEAGAKATWWTTKKAAKGGWAVTKAAAVGSYRGTAYALGASKRGLRNLNSGPKMSATQAMMPTGMSPANPKGSTFEFLPDGKTKETQKNTITGEDGKKKVEHTHDKITTKDGKEVSTSVKRETFDDAGNSTGSVTVEHDKVTGTKKMTQKDEKDREVRIIVKEIDKTTGKATTTTQDNYIYEVDGKLSSFEKKIEEKIAGRSTVTKHVKVDAKTGTETDILPHP